ncbi:hypothetical protein [Microbacterium xylanilyticum]
MSDALDRRGAIARILPAGPAQSDDATLYATGIVYTVDPVKKTVQVGTRQGTVTLPAIADRYQSGGLARILLDPIQTRPVLVAGAVDPAAPAVVAGVSATGSGTVTITYQGASVTIPTASGTYTVGQSAWVILDEWGVPVVAVGPSTAPAPGWASSTAPGSGGTVVATATIGSQDSGTWLTSGGRWDSWNTDRYGGRTDIYQGDAYGSGPLLGWAGYGDQIVNLGAVAISSILLTARKNDVNGLSAALTVQGTASGGRPGGAPAGAAYGTASTAAIGPGNWGTVNLPAALNEAFRTGAVKGLIAVGSDYGGFGGTATPGSFVLTITYTKNV